LARTILGQAYPVALAMFSAIVAPEVDRLGMADAPRRPALARARPSG
jgi:hypothetical protein